MKCTFILLVQTILMKRSKPIRLKKFQKLFYKPLAVQRLSCI
ncbi:Uncharacterised protein [Acinetobacter baumannii]|nr:Uncharacterised protein [Acinetobacter baumannii]